MSRQAGEALRRKIAATRRDDPLQDDVVLRAWRMALARGLSDSAGLHATVTDNVTAEMMPHDIAALPEEGDLIALLENDSGRFGFAILDPQVLTGIIESLTMGRVTARAPKTRAPTPTDATMVADALDRVLALFQKSLRDHDMSDPALGFRFATRIEQGAALALKLEDAPHEMLTLSLSLAGGVRRGSMRLGFPPEWAAGQGADPKAEAEEQWRDRMETAVMASTVTLDARIGRIRMPIDEVMGLTPGATLPLLRSDLGRVRLQSNDGRRVGEGQLGQAGGFRAVRLHGPDAPADEPADWAPPPLPGIAEY
ncbi:flagellar motor switch protein FliM [Mesobaculum littorinae]|uniref:Flagellar motor switch protein FliM n=1 Tax=Mesobaculum littorinae TaxID=2486419 RepID=A0A438AKV2_9RHOB|nr:flagellar motor switch protein FliM [Mesobaculum littorinae]RVV99312.1 flagellar motor switch protein FliM [Mesobaculum littorinae]